MKIKYVHFSEPEKEKICDTEKTYRNYISFNHIFFDGADQKTQKEWDIFELSKMERDLKRGHILSYEAIN